MTLWIRALIVAQLGIVLLVAGPARARELTVITIEAAPWASLDHSGGAIGLCPDVVREMARRTGLTITVTLQPFARIGHELESGRQDCTVLVWNPEWERFALKGELVSTHVVGVVPRKGVTIRSYDDLHGLRLSVLRGLSLGEPFDSDAAIIKSFDADYLTGLRKLARSRADGVVGAVPTIRYLAQQDHLEAVLGGNFVMGEVPLLLQCSRKSANLDVMEQLDAAIRAMRIDGTMERMKTSNAFF